VHVAWSSLCQPVSSLSWQVNNMLLSPSCCHGEWRVCRRKVRTSSSCCSHTEHTRAKSWLSSNCCSACAPGGPTCAILATSHVGAAGYHVSFPPGGNLDVSLIVSHPAGIGVASAFPTFVSAPFPQVPCRLLLYSGTVPELPANFRRSARRCATPMACRLRPSRCGRGARGRRRC
jgi:hypothetical protein